MGINASYIALHGVPREEILALMEFKDTGIEDEAYEADFSIADMPTGWTILWSSQCEYLPDSELFHLPFRCRHSIVGCCVLETTMMSVGFGYDYDDHGKMCNRWIITHEASKGRDNLECTGTLPPESRAIIDAARAEAGTHPNVDVFFDIPVSVIQSLTGFRYDQPVYDGKEIVFTELRSLTTA
ncbi:hypothetical protein [Komagataeibacter xylinus]|uniref:Uncharacterized protein n=1 Tax=Komagataeibacter xylinus TaxID=28448 RepID=A0A857FQX3_KOMXY|nr:hypothetical protein [Komagataeibacter xylinus]QHC36566.1 hypothetical protein FMA36_14590 [Komagataeibacter xylinus]